MPNNNDEKKQIKKTIVLALPHFLDMFGSYYAMELMKGVGKAIEDSPYDLQLHIFDAGMEEDAIKEHLTSVRNLGGVMFADIGGNRKIISMARKNSIPYIVMNNIFEDNETNYIGIDNKAASKDAVKYLIDLGHKKIAAITGNMKTQSAIMRLEGYKAALAANNIPENPEYIVNGAYNREKAQEAMMKLMNEKSRPTAIFAASDLMAFGAIMVALKEDIRVPEDVSIMGFDNSPLAALGHVTITTVNQPLAETGMIAAKALMDIIEGRIPPPFQKVLKATLIMGSSCRKI